MTAGLSEVSLSILWDLLLYQLYSIYSIAGITSTEINIDIVFLYEMLPLRPSAIIVTTLYHSITISILYPNTSSCVIKYIYINV